MIFEDDMLQDGELGGKRATAQLSRHVHDYIAQTLPEMPSNYKIVARVYANLKGLTETCFMAGVTPDNPYATSEFARGFTGSKQLYDYVDVGMGKDRADEKISGK